MRRFWGALLTLLILSGCSTMNVVTDYSEQANFTKFHTFQYQESSNTFADTSPLAHQRIVDGIKDEMTAAGFREANADPDLYVTYYGEKNETIELQTIGWDYHHPPDWRMRNSSIRSQRYSARHRHSTTRVVTIREGTLLIDIWEAANKELVWRAEISDTLSDNPDRNTANINRGLSRAFENFPPVSSK